MKNHALIFAGGTGTRMNSKSLPKQFLRVYGKPVIIHTLEQFQNCTLVDNIIVVILKGWEDYLWDFIRKYDISKVSKVVPGGGSGQQSIYNGLQEISSGLVLVHDGVRPFISDALIRKNIEMAAQKRTAISCVKAKETLVSVKNGVISHSMSRGEAFMARAPQTFEVELLRQAHQRALEEGDFSFIDSCSIVKHYFPEVPLNIVECGAENIKITTQEDFYLAKAMFSIGEDAQLYDYQIGSIHE